MTDDKKAVCIMAWPAGHSRSPLIHNYWIKQHNLNAEYRREAVPPEKFEEFVTHLREHGYIGGNVTVPHKETVLALSEPDERARAVGAANCLWYDDDTLRSTNTDVDGFLANLDAAAPGWDRGLETAVVLGAGGGARAAVFALIQRSVGRIYVINRTRERAQGLKKKFGARVQVAGWDETTGLLGGAGLLVNTTTMGMVGQPPLEINLRCPRLAGGVGPGLCPVGNRTIEVGPRTRPAHRRRSRHAAASGGARFRTLVRREARSDRGTPRFGRGRSAQQKVTVLPAPACRNNWRRVGFSA